MNKKLLIWIGGLLAALIVVGAVGATAVYADDSTPPAFSAGAPDGGRGHGGRGMGQAELDAAAKVLGMTSDELSTALQSGKTSGSPGDERRGGHPGCPGRYQYRPPDGNAHEDRAGGL